MQTFLVLRIFFLEICQKVLLYRNKANYSVEQWHMYIAMNKEGKEKIENFNNLEKDNRYQILKILTFMKHIN